MCTGLRIIGLKFRVVSYNWSRLVLYYCLVVAPFDHPMPKVVVVVVVVRKAWGWKQLLGQVHSVSCILQGYRYRRRKCELKRKSVWSSKRKWNWLPRLLCQRMEVLVRLILGFIDMCLQWHTGMLCVIYCVPSESLVWYRCRNKLLIW